MIAPWVVELVIGRDEKRCAWCGDGVWGERGLDWSIHHRRARGMAGDRRPETDAAGNLVLLHGHGSAGCHGEVESRRANALARGFLVPKLAIDPPAAHAIEHAVHGWTYLTDDGRHSTEPPP